MDQKLKELLDQLAELDPLYERYRQGDPSVCFFNLRHSLDSTMAAFRALKG